MITIANYVYMEYNSHRWIDKPVTEYVLSYFRNILITVISRQNAQYKAAHYMFSVVSLEFFHSPLLGSVHWCIIIWRHESISQIPDQITKYHTNIDSSGHTLTDQLNEDIKGLQVDALTNVTHIMRSTTPAKWFHRQAGRGMFEDKKKTWSTQSLVHWCLATQWHFNMIWTFTDLVDLHTWFIKCKL